MPSILVSHFAIDLYGGLILPILGILENRCHLTPEQTAWLLGVGSLCSGLSQPICAFLSDQWRTRIFGPLGLFVSSIMFCLIGYPTSAVGLSIAYGLAMIGVGMYHPITAATVGQINPAARSWSLSLFFVAGMAGGIAGAMIGSRLVSAPSGFQLLPWAMFPGIVLAIWLQATSRNVPPRVRPSSAETVQVGTRRVRWGVIGLLYIAAALRFSVNTVIVYLYMRWIQSLTQQTHADWTPAAVSQAAAPIVGDLNALTMVGMAIGGLAAGWVRDGREKWPLIVVPLIFTPVFVVLPLVHFGWAYLLAVLAGTGFAMMIPVTITVAQRLLPNQTSLASGMMLGGAWTLALFAPRLAEYVIQQTSVLWAFIATAVTLAASGLVLLPVPEHVLRNRH